MTDQELKVLTDIRWALGDNGKRMQSELVEYARQIKKDADEVFRLRERVRDLEADKLDPNGQDPIPLGQPRNKRLLGPNTIPTARLIELETAEHERDILRTESAALKREAHTWSKAAETYAASEARLADALTELVALEDMRLRLRELHEMGHGTDYYDYHRRLPLAWDAARAALGPNVVVNGGR